jgi:GH24 family phage-related lysozyme (muramidase)
VNDSLNKSVILGHEGTRLVAYHDTEGYLTVGVGFNLDAAGASLVCEKLGIDYHAVIAGTAITQTQCDNLFTYSYGQVVADIITLFPNFQSMPDNVVAVPCDMRYELGFVGFRGFHEFIAAIKSANYPAAIAAMWDSLWAKQVPTRVQSDVALLEAVK